MFPVDLQLKIQPFGPESAFFRDSPSVARGGVAQLPARRPRCMRRQGQRSPSVSVFFAVLRCFFRVPSEGWPPGSFTPLVAHPEPSAPHPWLRAPCGFFGSLLPIVSARRAGRRALAPCVSESSRQGVAHRNSEFGVSAASFARLFGGFGLRCCGAVDN